MIPVVLGVSNSYANKSKADLIKMLNQKEAKSVTTTEIVKDENGAFTSVLSDDNAGFRGTSLNIAVSKNGVVRANTNKTKGGTCVIAKDLNELTENMASLIALAKELTKNFVPQPKKVSQ